MGQDHSLAQDFFFDIQESHKCVQKSTVKSCNRQNPSYLIEISTKISILWHYSIQIKTSTSKRKKR